MTPSYLSSPSPAPSYVSHNGPTISRIPSDRSIGRGNNRSHRENSRIQNLEAKEILRIMDPSYLSPQTYSTIDRTSAHRRLSGDFCYVDAQGHLHDIDYRPFPLIRSDSPHMGGREFKDTPNGGSGRPPPKHSHTSPLPRPRSPQVPYWETFTLAQQDEYSDDPEEATSDFICNNSRSYQVDTHYSHAEHTSRYPVYLCADSLGVGVDEQTERKLLTKPQEKAASGVKNDLGKAICGVVYGNKEDNNVQVQDHEAETRGDEERSRTNSPKQKLHQVWIATRFDMRLRMIRSQRWLREHIQGGIS